MLLAYFVSIIAGIFSGITESINKNITEEKYSVFSYFTLQIGLNLLLITIPFLLFGSFPKLGIVYIYMFMANVAILIGNSSAIKAYKTEDISNTTILFQMSLVMPIILGVLLLHEKINPYNILGMVAILIGIIVIFFERKKLRPSSGYLFALLSGIFFGLVIYFDKLASAYTDPISLIFITDAMLTAFLLLIPKTYQDIRPIFKKYSKKIIISRFTALADFYLIIWAFQRSNVSVSNTNSATAFLLSCVFIGILFLGEKKNIKKKITGSILCTLGIILLNFF